MDTGPVRRTVCLFTPPAYAADHQILLLGDGGKCVNSLSKVALDSAPAEIEPAILSSKP